MCFGRIFENGFLDLLIHHEHFEDGLTTTSTLWSIWCRLDLHDSIAKWNALFIFGRKIGKSFVNNTLDAALDFNRLASARRKHGNQTLSNREKKGRSNKIRIDTHINETRD